MENILMISKLRIKCNYIVSNDQAENDAMGGACNANGGKRNAYRILVGTPKEKRPQRNPRRGWVYNIKMELR
jgi:hypothetical protein